MAESWGANDWASLNGAAMQGPTAWSTTMPSLFAYDQRKTAGQEYAPYAKGLDYAPISGFSSKIISQTVDEYLQREYPEYDQFETDQYGGQSTVGRVGSKPGFGQFDTTADAYIQNSAQTWGIPPNLLKAIIAKESSGDWKNNDIYHYMETRKLYILPYIGLTDPATRAMGVENPRSMVGNQAGQIDLLAKLLRSFYDNPTVGGQYGWDGVMAYHYSGNPDQSYTPEDTWQHGSTAHYVRTAKEWWRELDAYAGNEAGSFEPGGLPENATIPTGEGNLTQVEAIWGGTPGNVTQPLGQTAFSTGEGAWMYGNSYQVGHPQGHTGVDYGMENGTKLYSPVSGEVRAAGGTGFYRDNRYGNAAQTGELRILTDQGHEVILGHMGQIYPTVGTRVNPGDYVGLSGQFGTGPHLHLEYRTPGANTPSGWLAVDPAEALGGAFAGTFQQGVLGAGISRPMTFADLMRAGASGQTIYPGATMSTGSGWHDWLRGAMKGEAMSYDMQRPAGTPYGPAYGKYTPSRFEPGTMPGSSF